MDVLIQKVEKQKPQRLKGKLGSCLIGIVTFNRQELYKQPRLG